MTIGIRWLTETAATGRSPPGERLTSPSGRTVTAGLAVITGTEDRRHA